MLTTSWPKTVDEAVDLIISTMAGDEKQETQCIAEEDLVLLHLGLEKTSETRAGYG
jgi:hypothetical protein